VQAGKLYLVAGALRTASALGLQGKALYVEYEQAGRTYGAYASAFWGTADWQTFVALLAAPAGVERMALAPALIDNAGKVWLDQVRVTPLP
jgi:hypothetical protein